MLFGVIVVRKRFVCYIESFSKCIKPLGLPKTIDLYLDQSWLVEMSISNEKCPERKERTEFTCSSDMIDTNRLIGLVN